MALTILFATFFFILISFLTSLPTVSANPLISYFQIQGNFLTKNFIVVLIGLSVWILIFNLTHKFSKDLTFTKKITSSSIHIFQIVFLSFFLSFVALFTLAFIQINVETLLLNLSPRILNVKVKDTEIVDSLKKINSAPRIIITDNSRKIARGIAQASTGTDTFYGRQILEAVPEFLVVPANTRSSIMLIDKTLIISDINSKELEEISPIVGYKFVKEYFGNKIVRSYPKIEIMDSKAYADYRIEESREKIVKINQQLLNIKGYISSVSAAIENDRIQVANFNDLINSDNKNSQFDKCLENYSEDYCKGITAQAKIGTNSKLQNELKEWEKQLKVDEDLLEAYKYYETLFQQQKAVVGNFQNVVLNEKGIYEPKDSTIKIRLEEKNPHSLGDFFAIVVHEYFHYASYQEGKHFKNTFFEEGLTEFFSRQVIKYNLEFNPNLGYPIQSKIVAQLSKRIAENELISIYFSKDDSQFIGTLDRVYGEGFYENNKNAFEAFQYSLPPGLLVKIANGIMPQIGGEKLKEEDYASTESEL